MPNTPPDTAPLTGKRFLVVEDEFLILLDIQSTLETAGAKSVVTASRVQDALNTIIDSEKIGANFDAAVLDLKLDHESSAPIAERLASAGVPFIFLTGAPTDVALAKQFGAAPIVGKPFDGTTLLNALQTALEKR
jgi:DNA-binding response OmpR family regulator